MNPKAVAYCGIDLHKAAQLRKPIFIELEADRLDRDTILGTLRTGNFTVNGSNIAIPSTGNLTFVQELSIAVKQPLCRPWAG